MAMEDIMKALMQSAGGAQQPSGGGTDAMSQVLGGLLGGGQQDGGAGGEALAQAVGGLLGGGQQGGAAVTQLLGGLQQIMGGTPGSGQLPQGGGNMNMGANDPIMMLLQPVVDQLAVKAKISPQLAMIVASIAVHYLLQSHPSTPGSSPLNLGSVMQSLASGSGISQGTLQSSGMLNDVMQATGLNEQQATKSLTTTFNSLAGHVQGSAGAGKRKQ
jgi:hypothetical protein